MIPPVPGLESKFKLSSRFSTGNMMLFDASGAIKRYHSPEAIIEEFFTLRLEYYEKRRSVMIKVRGGLALTIKFKLTFNAKRHDQGVIKVCAGFNLTLDLSAQHHYQGVQQRGAGLPFMPQSPRFRSPFTFTLFPKLEASHRLFGCLAKVAFSRAAL